MRELLSIGNKVLNVEGDEAEITSVQRGYFGLLVKGKFIKDLASFESFLPYELPPCEQEHKGVYIRWYGWRWRSLLVLPNGMKLGTVAFGRSDARSTIEAYDAEWERTISLMQEEYNVQIQEQEAGKDHPLP